MTDNELKALVASIAEGQKKTDEQLNRTDAKFDRTDAQIAEMTAQMKRTDAKFDRTDAQIAEMTAQMKRTDAKFDRTDAQIAEMTAQMKRTDAQLAETDAQLKRTDIQVEKTSKKVDKVAAMYGGMANNQGAIAEEFYYNTLKHSPVLQDVRFDVVYKNMTAMREGIEDEYDILLINGKTVYIIEVKCNAHFNDVKKLINKKAKNFPILFPQYAGYEHYLGLACFHIDDDTKKEALAVGVNILQRRGDVIETVAPQKRAA